MNPIVANAFAIDDGYVVGLAPIGPEMGQGTAADDDQCGEGRIDDLEKNSFRANLEDNKQNLPLDDLQGPVYFCALHLNRSNKGSPVCVEVKIKEEIFVLGQLLAKEVKHFSSDIGENQNISRECVIYFIVLNEEKIIFVFKSSEDLTLKFFAISPIAIYNLDFTQVKSIQPVSLRPFFFEKLEEGLFFFLV